MGAPISDEQLDMQSILERHIKHFVCGLLWKPLPWDEPRNVSLSCFVFAQELPRDPNMASGVDLPELVSALHAEFDPYGGRGPASPIAI